MSVDPVQHGSARQEISRGIVAVIKKHIGRGPTSARAYVEDEMVTVLLQETLTTVERTLTEHGEGSVVATMREQFDGLLCDEAVTVVEESVGRKVEAFMSGHSIEPDFSVFCFVLKAAGEDPDAAPCDSPQPREEPRPVRASR